MKQILVMGSGAVGGFYGAHLARKNDLSVTFVARGAHLEAMRRDGLRITGAEDFHLADPNVVSDPAEASDPPDLILVTVKSTDTLGVIEQLRPIIRNHTRLLTLQNGLENYELLADAFGTRNVIRGFCRIGVEVTKPGVIDYRGFSEIRLGEENGTPSNQVLQLQKIFEYAGITCEVSPDIRREAWLKFIWNGVFNMLTGLANVTTNRIFEDQYAYATAWQLFYEMQAVAGASGIYISDEEGAEIIDQAEELGAFRTSTFQDRQRGKPLEYDVFCGYITRKADELDLDAPVNRAFNALYRMMPDSSGL